MTFLFQLDKNEAESLPSYNITACCQAAGVLPQCMPLCTYDIKVSDLQLLGQTCSLQMGMLLKFIHGNFFENFDFP